MEVPRSFDSTTKARRTPPHYGYASRLQRHLLPTQNRMSVAYAPEGFPSELNCLPLLSQMATPGSVGENEPSPARPSARADGQIPSSERYGCRLSISEDGGKKGEVYGFDGGKKVKGRKRHLLVDSVGLLFKVLVTEGNGGERVAAAYGVMCLLMESEEYLRRMQVLWVDSGYEGGAFALAIWLMIQARVEVIKRNGKEFEVLAKRWIVERTLGWLNWYRRLSKDYERLPEMSEAAIYAVMTRIMLRRLAA